MHFENRRLTAPLRALCVILMQAVTLRHYAKTIDVDCAAPWNNAPQNWKFP